MGSGYYDVVRDLNKQQISCFLTEIQLLLKIISIVKKTLHAYSNI